MTIEEKIAEEKQEKAGGTKEKQSDKSNSDALPNKENKNKTAKNNPKSPKASPEKASEKMIEEIELEERKAEQEKIKEIEKKIEEDLKSERGERKFKRESPEERAARESQERLDRWVPKTQLGKEVLAGKIKNIQEVFDAGGKILESEIVDSLLKLKVELLNIGQAKGKFGGGKRRAWRQTQKKTKEGNVVTFGVMAVVGDGNGHMGIGFGKAQETLPAKEKAIRKAKLNIKNIARGCASYDCSCDELHSIPMAVEGKCSSVIIKLIPAPQGTGLVAGDEIKKILKLAGIKDVYSKCFGKSRTTINAAKACLKALDKLGEFRL